MSHLSRRGAVAFLFFAFFLLGTPSARADSLTGALCPSTGTYALLEQIGSCTIGGLTFSGFAFGNVLVGPGAAVQDSQLSFRTVDQGTSAAGFQFSLANPLTSTAGMTNNLPNENLVDVAYNVTGASISGAALSLAAQGPETASNDALLCPGQSFAALPVCQAAVFLATAAGAKLSDMVGFPPVSTLGVVDTSAVIGEESQISGFTNTFSGGETTVPEPPSASTMLLAGGIGAVLMRAAKRQGKSQLAFQGSAAEAQQ